MKNSNELEKSRGVVVFAFNSSTVDYVRIADQTSRLTAHTLGLPITLITDSDATPKFAYDHIIRVDTPAETLRLDQNSKQITWRNFGRYLAYELSPYTETILLDTDYLVFDRSLLNLFNTDFDYKLMHNNRSIDGMYTFPLMGETSLPFIWATVVLFRKTERSKLFFNLIGRIQRNYEYYRALYNVRERNYRNDYAFAIANTIINGYNPSRDQGIPWTMHTVDKSIERIMLTDNFLRIYNADEALVVPYSNLHVMDKTYLQSRDFEQVVEAICEPT